MRARLTILVLAVAVSLPWLAGSTGPQLALAAPAPTGGPTPLPPGCAFPSGWSPGNPVADAQLAWQLFVAANCNTGSQLAWEGWIEQLDLYTNPTAAKKAVKHHRLHGSPLALVRMARKSGMTLQLSPSTDCNPMGNPPSNVVQNTICEEVHLNPFAQSFLTSNSNNYQFRSGQILAAQNGTDIQFPLPAIEVKVDWIPGSDYNPPFTCSTPPPGVHVENIDGTCYAMAGMHIISKLAKNWIWATFEPQSSQTNPNRCKTYGPCNDPWGSQPAVSYGGVTAQTPALQALMASANLAPEFANYRLDGVQTQFVDAQNNPTLLGNSIIEGENAAVPPGQASCITCHSISSIKTDGTDGITLLGSVPQIGPEYQPPAGWIARDFVWSMLLACPGGNQPNCPASTTTAAKLTKKTGKKK